MSNFICNELKNYIKLDNINTKDGKIIGTGSFGIIYLFYINNIKYCIKFEKIRDKDNYEEKYLDMINNINNINNTVFNPYLFFLSICNNKLYIDSFNNDIFKKTSYTDNDNNYNNINIKISISQYGMVCNFNNISSINNDINNNNSINLIIVLDDISKFNDKYIYYGDIKLDNLIYYLNGRINIIDYDNFYISNDSFIDRYNVDHSGLLYLYSLGIIDESVFKINNINFINIKLFYLYDTICLFICILCILFNFKSYEQFGNYFKDDIKLLYDLNTDLNNILLNKIKIDFNNILYNKFSKIILNRYNDFKNNNKLNDIITKKLLVSS
jgi:hypothetical protein